ncbi:hypothetical protein OG824_31570 [Streptomyces prunicolor]|uniref:hypothetical protein n=1 Tax=Streptomyces prunicolor TaxID=67348 RepID=UPI002251C3F3|nr:hypothetical protein [Streptomyces prunicolor]MCX5239749.1 hypothetical protein [Streptomyces prunicolor]
MTHTQRSIAVTRREFAVPVDPAYGAYHVAVSKAWQDANRSYRDDHQLRGDNAPLPDNAISFWPGDTEIVISYETEKPAAPSVDDVARLLAAHDHLGGRLSRPYAHLAVAEQQHYADAARNVLDFASAATPAHT